MRIHPAPPLQHVDPPRCAAAKATSSTCGTATAPTTSRAPGLFVELEVRPVGAVRLVVELDHQLAARPRPGLVGLPGVGVLVAGRVVAQPAGA
jgi:hypothetical protein